MFILKMFLLLVPYVLLTVMFLQTFVSAIKFSKKINMPLVIASKFTFFVFVLWASYSILIAMVI